MSTNNVQTSDDVRASISTIYSDLLSRRRAEREEKEELKRLKAEEKRQKKEEQQEKSIEKMTKAERRQAEYDSWKQIIVGLTGDDLDYVEDKKKKKKKYRKWIDDSQENSVDPAKVKKPKKRNYHKEFEPDLQMLKSLLADQNRFSTDLLKRYQNAAGPNTKDAAPLNKTLVDLIANINTSRANALGMVREIGNIKKTIADLYMKQKKLDADLGNATGGPTNGDLALLGSTIADSIFGDNAPTVAASYGGSNTQSYYAEPQSSGYIEPARPTAVSSVPSTVEPVQKIPGVSSFDPSTWEGPKLDASDYTNFEAIPHHVVVEWKKDEGLARFKAIRDDTNEELVGAPVPSVDPIKLKFNEKDMNVKGEFDETYELEII